MAEVPEPHAGPPPVDPAKMSGIVTASEQYGHMALWFDAATSKVISAMILAWRVVGPVAYAVTLLPAEAHAIKRPDGVIVDQKTGTYWTTEDAWVEHMRPVVVTTHTSSEGS